MAAESSAGAIAERYVAVAVVDIFVPTYNEDLNVVKNTISLRWVSTGRKTS